MNQAQPATNSVVVIGAGPAGLAAAYSLVKADRRTTVLEKDRIVGGLARTENYRGYRFDMGGHRFFTKAPEVEEMWREVLGDDFLRRPRLSRIHYRGRFFSYPLKPLNAILGLGPIEGLRIVASYLRWQIRPHPVEETFEQWVTNRFGKRLFEIFFKGYTEKVWGIPCSELRAEWAAQRIKDLSLRTAILNMFLKPRRTIRTLIEEFDYPRLGPGMMWTAVREAIEAEGGEVRLGADVVRICRTGGRVDGVVVRRDGREEVVPGDHFLSSMPVSELVRRFDPPPPPEVLDAAGKLGYRDFLTVCLILDRPEVFPDNWIYIQDPEVRVGRIQNFKNWSPEMVPDPTKTSLGLEYFCNEGDDFWNRPDAELIELAQRELEDIRLARSHEVEDGCVFRVSHAYPVYDAGYAEPLAVVQRYVEGLENLQTIGRNGLHRYNNQDHAMVTGMLAVQNVLNGHRHDLWAVNTDGEYHEEIDAGVGQDVEHALAPVLPKLDRLAFGISTGAIAGLALFAATLWLTIRGGAIVGPTLGLLAQFYPGYTVTLSGSFVGLGYGFVTGFVAGWAFALIRNAFVLLYVTRIRRRAERHELGRLYEYI